MQVEVVGRRLLMTNRRYLTPQSQVDQEIKACQQVVGPLSFENTGLGQSFQAFPGAAF